MFINTDTLQRVTEQDIRAAHPNTSFATPFSPPDGYAVLFASPQPTCYPVTEMVRETTPAPINGQWFQRWEVASRFVEYVDERGVAHTVAEQEAAALAADLAEAKALKNAEINAARLRANRGNFIHDGQAFSCDELSRSDIDGITSFVTLNGSLPPGWPGAWKAADNSFYAIPDVAGWKAFVASMVSAGNANFAKAQALKMHLAAATTKAEVAAVVW